MAKGSNESSRPIFPVEEASLGSRSALIAASAARRKPVKKDESPPIFSSSGSALGNVVPGNVSEAATRARTAAAAILDPMPANGGQAPVDDWSFLIRSGMKIDAAAQTSAESLSPVITEPEPPPTERFALRAIMEESPVIDAVPPAPSPVPKAESPPPRGSPSGEAERALGSPAPVKPSRIARVAALPVFGLSASILLTLDWSALGRAGEVWVPNLLLATVAFLFARFAVAIAYRPPRAAKANLPSVSLVLEERDERVAMSIRRSFHLIDYPAEKLQVVASATAARNDLIVFLPHRASLDPQAVRKIVLGFADPRVAAVAGRIEIANGSTNAATRLREAREVLGARIREPSASVLGTVLPGSFYACRREAFSEAGEPAALPAVGRVLYSSEAIAFVSAPDRSTAFFAQEIRNARRRYRSSLTALRHRWNQPIAALRFLVELTLPLAVAALLVSAFVVWPIVGNLLPMALFTFGVALVGLMLAAQILFWKPDLGWLYGVGYAFLYAFVLCWLAPTGAFRRSS